MHRRRVGAALIFPHIIRCGNWFELMSFTPEGCKNVATGGATPPWASRNPWKHETCLAHPGGVKGSSRQFESAFLLTRLFLCPFGAEEINENRFPRVALRPPARTALHPWLQPVAPSGHKAADTCVGASQRCGERSGHRPPCAEAAQVTSSPPIPSASPLISDTPSESSTCLPA